MKRSLKLVYSNLYLLAILLFSTYSASAQQFDVRIEKSTITAGPVRYGVNIPYNVTIYNDGIDTIQNVVIRDFVSEGYMYNSIDNLTWANDPVFTNAVTTTYLNKIPPNESAIVTLLLEVVPSGDPTTWDNVAELVSFTDRFNTDRTAENVSTEVSSSSSISIVDLALTKELLTAPPYRYGDTLTFRNTIVNQGNLNLGNVTIVDLIPEGYINPTDENVTLGWTNMAVNPNYIFPTVPVGSTQTIDFRLILSMNMVNENAWDNYAAITLVRNEANDNLFFIDADSDPGTNSDEERSVKPGDPDDNYIGNMPVNPGFQDDHDPAGPVIYDLAIIKERLTGPPSYSYGGEIEYSIDIFNQGNRPVQDIIFKDSLPCGIEDLDMVENPGWTYDATTRVATYVFNDTLLPSASERFLLRLDVRPCFDDPYSAWTNVTEIFEARDYDGNVISDIDSNADDNFSNDPGGIPGSASDNALNGNGVFDEDDSDTEYIEVVDIAIRKTTVTEGPYEEGQLVEFDIEIFNQGNVDAIETFIEEFIPEGFAYEQAINGPLGWSQPVQVGPNSFNRLANTLPAPLLAGDSTNIRLQLRLELDGTMDSDWYNYAHVLIIRDSLGVNRFDEADSRPFNETPEERLVIPGDSNDDNIFTLGENFGEDQDDHDPATIAFYDLSLTKSVQDGPYIFGQDLLFTIDVKNESNRPANSFSVVDRLPCGFTFNSGANAENALWSQLPNGDLTYTDDVALWPGQTRSIELTLTLVECTQANAYSNVAEITASTDGDDMPGNDQDSTPDNSDPDEDDQDEVTVPIFDLSLEKFFTTPPTDLSVGAVLDYTIRVTNEGSVDATNVVVEDDLPCGLVFNGSPGWTNVGGELSYDMVGMLAAGTSRDISLQLTIGTCAPGETTDYNNSAEIVEADDPDGNPGDDADSIPDNNDPDEDDQDSQPLDIFDLSLSKSLVTTGPYEYDQILEYNITVTNQGTINATSYTVVEYVQCGLRFDLADNTGWNINGDGNRELAVNNILLAGANETFTVRLRLEECDTPSAANAWSNIAEINSATDADGPADDQDSTPGNEDPDEDDQDQVPFDVYDLSLQKNVVSTALEYEIGEIISYEITVTNEGNVAALSYEITDRPPCNLSLAPNNTEWTTNNDGTLSRLVSAPLAVGASATFPIQLRAVECDEGEVNAVNVSEITNVRGPNDGSFPDFDSTPDNSDEDEDDQDDAEVIVVGNALIGDFVFDDLDGDGIQDFNESGIPGVQINVFNDDQNLVTTVITDQNGMYEVELPTGNYYLDFILEDESYDPTIPLATSPNNDSNITGDFGTNTTSLFSVVNGQDDFSLDAGFFRCERIQGTAWYDEQDDDVRQDFENGVNGLVVNLFRQVNGSFELWASTTTGHKPSTPSDDGFWDFCVSPGTYYVEVIMPPIGLVRVRPNVGFDENRDSDINSNNRTNTFTLVSGQPKTDLGAGYAPMATLSASVWLDENQNGLQENFESRMEGIEVEVYNEASELIKTTTTDEDGEYMLDYMRKESYYLKFSAPAEYSFTYNVSDDEGINSDVDHSNGANTTKTFALLPGMEVTDLDAGLALGVLPVSWLSVGVVENGKSNLLQWTTSQEVNNNHFEIERSDDGGFTYRTLSKVKASTKAGDKYYQFEDDSWSNKLSYYRVKQVDYDGKFGFSKVVSLVRGEATDMGIYPNPTRNFININASENTQFILIDAMGKMMINTKVGPTARIDMTAIPAGTYGYRLVSSTGASKVGKLIRI